MTAEDPTGETADRDEAILDDFDEEERDRYRELLEEFRTVLPGVQVLLAFLLTAPFSSRFADLDALGRSLYATALVLTALASVLFLTPASFHRIAPRSLREERLAVGIRVAVAGMLALGSAISVAVFVVLRFVFDSAAASIVTAGLAGAIVVFWYVLPLVRRSAS